jgi:Ni/Co efflux regulator RcnB
MPRHTRFTLVLATALAVAAGPALAQERDSHEGREGVQPARAEPRAAEPRPAPPRPAEPHPGPRGYQRPAEPQGWNARPAAVDRGAYQHNFKAARAYRVGPYHPPEGWSARRWSYGEVLPRAYWAPEFFIGDYWLFGLEVPPTGYEWVRDGDDALLVDTNSGEILQVEYGVFA